MINAVKDISKIIKLSAPTLFPVLILGLFVACGVKKYPQPPLPEEASEKIVLPIQATEVAPSPTKKVEGAKTDALNNETKINEPDSHSNLPKKSRKGLKKAASTPNSAAPVVDGKTP